MKFFCFIFFTLIQFEKGYSQSPKQLNFCGEIVPLEYPFIAKKLDEALKQNSRNNTRFEIILKQAEFYFPYIEAMLKKHGIPDDFKYLPIIESDFKKRAISNAGAKGFWQLMPNTAKELGLSVKEVEDERASIVISTNAACKHIKYLHSKLKSWTLVAAAYNVGLGALQKSMNRQRIYNYYFLELNSETGDYLYRVLATKIIFGNTTQLKGSNNILQKKIGFNTGLLQETQHKLN